jgi:hypothetical protein
MVPEAFIEFDEFQVDTKRLLLRRKSGRPCELGQTAVRVLIELLRHPGVELSVAALLDAVWVRRGRIVVANNVHHAIAAIRKQLNDTDSAERRFIINNGNSYRWIYDEIRNRSPSPSSVYGTVFIAESDLIVVNALTSAWQLDLHFAKLDYLLIPRPFLWSDDVLAAIDDGILDLAIYNVERTRRYQSANPNSIVERLSSDCCVSMRGQNFYVLGQRGGRWSQRMQLGDFTARLFEGGARIAVPEDSDMLDNLLLVMSSSLEQLQANGVEVIRITTNDGLTRFSEDPDLLMIHGQNVRFQARYRSLYCGADYIEVLDHSSLADPAQPVALKSRAANCIVFRRDLFGPGTGSRLQAMVDRATQTFRDGWQNSDSLERLLRDLTRLVFRAGTRDPSEAEFVVREIVRGTYGIGNESES